MSDLTQCTDHELIAALKAVNAEQQQIIISLMIQLERLENQEMEVNHEA